MNRFQYNRINEVLEENNKDIYWLHSQLKSETIPVVTRWCKNVKQPTIEQLFEIARILQVDVRELLVSSSSKATVILKEFQGKKDVRHIISASGNVSWLTREVSFEDETHSKGACKLNTVENETKHVLFLFNSDNEEVGRYYIGKSLQGKTPSELVAMKNHLVFFESWNPESSKWVPCVGPYGKLSNRNGKEGCGRVTIFKDGCYSVEDKHGNIIVPPGRYTYIDGFEHNLARVKIDGMTSINNSKESTVDKWGIIDIDGNEVLPVKYSEIWGFYGKDRHTTKVIRGGKDEEDIYNKYVCEYEFDLITLELKDIGYYDNGNPNYLIRYDEDNCNQYSIMDALDGEPEAAGNIDYEW